MSTLTLRKCNIAQRERAHPYAYRTASTASTLCATSQRCLAHTHIRPASVWKCGHPYFQRSHFFKRERTLLSKLANPVSNSFNSHRRIANRLSLKSRSRNDPDGGRYLVIQKKVSLLELANDIFNGGLQSRYYELISPTQPHLRKPTAATPSSGQSSEKGGKRRQRKKQRS